MSLGIVQIVTLQNAYVREVLKLQKLSVNRFFCSSHRAWNYITLHLPFHRSSISVQAFNWLYRIVLTTVHKGDTTTNKLIFLTAL